MAPPLFYTAFHLNLAFSSITEAQRPQVVRQCYWPLLRFAEKGLPIGIEATGYTLRAINAIDPVWIEKLRELIGRGIVEFIGSGYTQMIAPLVPAEVTRRNLTLGLNDYDELLDVRPTMALVNEQAYSAGLISLYKELGFKALMMDWAEPASHHPEWDHGLRGRPQMVQGTNGDELPVVWSDAIAFQKFQRYAHGEIDPQEYMEYLSLQLEDGVKALSLYTSDAEVFDFRPGRFEAEAGLRHQVEYERVEVMLWALTNSGEITLGLPSEALAHLDENAAPIRLESVEVPVPVKKQRKYNILRWAVSGRDDLTMNTYCWRLYAQLKGQGQVSDDQWRDLCRIWASDYRTHIDEKRWQALLEQAPSITQLPRHSLSMSDGKQQSCSVPDNVSVRRESRFLVIQTKDHHLVLNCNRGLAIQAFGFGELEPAASGAPGATSLIGTLAHGFYQDIAFGADFYSAHLVLEMNGRSKITDLQRCDPVINWCADEQAVTVQCELECGGYRFIKELRFRISDGHLTVTYDTTVPQPVEGVLRFGHVTLNPHAFQSETLYYSCCNGGEEREIYQLWQNGDLTEFDQGHAVSRLVSGRSGLGITDGILEIGDQYQGVRLEVKRNDAAGIAMMTSQRAGESLFLRGAVSLREMDETATRPSLAAAEKLGAPILRYGLDLFRKPARL